MSKEAIRVKNLSKVYKLYSKPIDRMKESLSLTKKKYSKEHYALRNISFDVKRGETLGIIGVNGAGKSTLLKIITGVLTQTSGEIIVNGKISALLELGAGFNPEYTGMENIYLNGTMMGYTKQEMDKRVSSIVDFADIGDFINQPVKTYSSGMFARLAFAVAINIEPDILIIDEALSVGDVFFQLKCFKKFDEFKRNNKTILFVSHSLGSIIKYCDRCIMLKEGSLHVEGDPKFVVDEFKKILSETDMTVENEQGDTSHNSNNVLWKSALSLNKEFLEYGDMDAEIIDFGLFSEEDSISNHLEKNREFKIKMKILFKKKIEHPIFAFTIKDLDGNEIAGTNTLLEEIETGIFNAQEIVTVIFQQKLILQGGPYFLSLGCTQIDNRGSLRVFHRLYDVVNLEILSKKNSNGYFDFNSSITIISSVN